MARLRHLQVDSDKVKAFIHMVEFLRKELGPEDARLTQIEKKEQLVAMGWTAEEVMIILNQLKKGADNEKKDERGHLPVT